MRFNWKVFFGFLLAMVIVFSYVVGLQIMSEYVKRVTNGDFYSMMATLFGMMFPIAILMGCVNAKERKK